MAVFVVERTRKLHYHLRVTFGGAPYAESFGSIVFAHTAALPAPGNCCMRKPPHPSPLPRIPRGRGNSRRIDENDFGVVERGDRHGRLVRDGRAVPGVE